jgi:hypothetical protein
MSGYKHRPPLGLLEFAWGLYLFFLFLPPSDLGGFLCSSPLERRALLLNLGWVDCLSVFCLETVEGVD